MTTLNPKRKNCTRHTFPFHWNSLVSVPVLMMAGVLVCSGVKAQTVLVPRVAVKAGSAPALSNPNLPTGAPTTANPNPVAGSTAANPVYAPNMVNCNLCTYTLNSAGTTATFNEAANTSGIVQWNSFNIGAGYTVNFKQASATSVLLNRVDMGLTASMINGVMNANGIVYFYNPNGIIFGKNAVVNVNSLVATSLNISDNQFLAGILSSSSVNPIFMADPNYVGLPGEILVDGDATSHATVSAATDGKIMLFAPNVVNNGVVTAPDGQVIMAAGGKVYLQSPTNTSMRGLYVEVDSSNLPAVGGVTPTTSVINNGAIAVGRGNASLVGLAISQNGSISAQTSVSLNGSIYLQAVGNAAAPSGPGQPGLPQTGGTLTLGAGSSTKITIVDDGSTITQGPGDAAFKPSQIQMSGQNITLQGSVTEGGKVVTNGADVSAQGGNVTISASANPSVPTSAPNSSSVVLGSGSVIDVSGDTKQTMAMSSNVIQVQLLSELADDLVLRDSVLRGKTLGFDIRTGTTIGDISADIAKVPYSVGELAAVGGTVTINSEGSITQNAGSTINVSGGLITYLAGYLNTTKLVSGGTLYSDSTASPDKIYTGIVNLPDGRWDYEPGYVEGKNAGTIAFNAPSLTLDGTLTGHATNGTQQRNVNASNYAEGGQLVINTVLPGEGIPAYSSNQNYNDQLVLDNNASAAALAGTTLAGNRIDVNVDTLKSSGFTRLNFTNAGEIDVAGSISLAAGGSISLMATDNLNNLYGDINFTGGITIPGGTLTAKAANTLTVNSGTQFNMAALWTNDGSTTRPTLDADGFLIGDIVTQGGSIALTANHVVIDNDVSMDVSGGAWLDTKHKLTSGDGGDISIEAVATTQEFAQSIPLIDLGSNLSLSSYSFTKGGTLTLETNNVAIGGIPPTPNVKKSLFSHDAASASSAPDPSQEYFWLPVGFFQQGGFTNYTIDAYSNFQVSPGSQITPLAQNWVFKNADAYRTVASGTMSSVAAPQLLDLVGPQGGRAPVSVTFQVQNVIGTASLGTMVFGTNAKITTDPTASVTLQAGQLLNFDGTIDAPGGTINLGLYVTGSQGDYSDQRSIWLGGEAHLFAQGSTSLLYTNGRGITSGSVLNGGQVTISDANDFGYLVVEQQSGLGLLGGATIDVSGVVSAPIVQTSSRFSGEAAPVASAGGSIDLQMREGTLFGGTMLGKAGNATQQGGTLTMTLQQGNSPVAGFPDNLTDYFNIVGGAPGGNIPGGLTPGSSIEIGTGTNTLANQIWISTGSFENGGFDRLNFKSQNQIVFSSASPTLTLDAKASIYLDAPTIVVASSSAVTDVQVNSAYVQLGSDDYRFQNTPTANSVGYVANSPAVQGFSSDVSSGGAATLDIKATTIDLVGTTVVQGVSTTNLTAAQDIRLVGMSQLAGASDNTIPTLAAVLPTGELSVTGTLNLTASQVYPITLSTYALNVEGANSVLNFYYNNYKGQAPLSAAGALYGYAQTINQSGVVLAPFGTIDLQAGTTLNYNKGSITSVAGNGTVPFGLVQNGRDWVYDFGGGNDVEFSLNPTTTGNYAEMALPGKAIVSQSPNINTASGATLNLSGGGSLYAYEFTAGAYGSVDVLSNTTASGAASNVYAINPNYTSAVAPRDYQYSYGSNLLPGQSVYLSGIPGLAAGNYVLLPAHYALLPGGMSITLAPNSSNMLSVQNVANLDGSVTVAGTGNVAGLGTSVNSGYVVTPGSVVRAESKYNEYSVSSFFSAAATAAGVVVPFLPADAGYLEFDASTNLALNGSFLLTPDKGGRQGYADISAPDIYVTADSSQTAPANALVLTAGELNAIDAGSLMLGGVRQVTSTGTNVTVGAQNITIENNSATALTGTEIILVAQDTIDVAAGSVIKASGTLTQTPGNITIQNTDANGNPISTDGALLRLSAGAPVTVTRQSPALQQGTLNIEQGAVLSATGSAYLDATLNTQNNGQLNLSAGATLGVSSSRISLGSNIPAAEGGLQFTTAELATLSSLSALDLNSYSTIGLWGAVNLGSSSMQNLALNASGIEGYGAGQNSTFTAQNISFGGGSNFTIVTAPAAPAGSLTVNALQNLTVAKGGSFNVNGYADVNLTAANTIAASGSGSFNAQNNLTLTSANVVANTLSSATLEAGAALTLVQNGSTVSPSGTQQLGGSLTLQGYTIASNANVTALSGQIAFNSTSGVNISGGTINAGGASEVFGTSTQYAPAGSITLNGGSGASGGNVVVNNATLNVSAVGASAGTLTVQATNGTATLNGALLGYATPVAGTTTSQGNFVLDVGQLTTVTQLDQINAQLNLNSGAAALTAGSLASTANFGGTRNFEVHNGDIQLDGNASSQVIAHNITISADNGSVNVLGLINATDPEGGNINIYAQQALASGSSGNVHLFSTALLSAYATSSINATAAGSIGHGGNVEIGTASADGVMQAVNNGGSVITLDSGAQINVGGNYSGANLDPNELAISKQTADGTVNLRAPQVSTGTGPDIVGTDVAIQDNGVQVSGSRLTTIEAFKVYTLSGVGATISSAADAQNPDGTYSNLQGATATGAVPTQGVLYSDASTFMNNNTVGSHLNLTPGSSNLGSNVVLEPGIEIRSDSDMLVSVNPLNSKLNQRGWNLDGWRFGPNNAPIILTLRAAGSLTIDGSISDGFTDPRSGSLAANYSMPDWTLDSTRSSSLRLIGGADFSAANPMAVIANSPDGDVTIQFDPNANSTAKDTPVALVRTGTGSINVAAGGDVVLGQTINQVDGTVLGATIYTAGMQNPDLDANAGAFTAPKDQLNTQYGASTGLASQTAAQFASDGGAISILASGNVIGAPASQLIDDWLFRQGATTLDANGNPVFSVIKAKIGQSTITANTAWWARTDYFDQGIATMAGGDVSVVAVTGNLQDVSASVATNGFMPGAAPANLVERGGGNLNVQAGGNIIGGSFYVQKGVASIFADGSITSGNQQTSLYGAPNLNTLLALGDAQLNVGARNSVTIEAAYNPTFTSQSVLNSGAVNVSNTNSLDTYQQFSNFSTYSDTSAVNLLAVGGDVLMTHNIASLASANSNVVDYGYSELYNYQPPNLNVVALTGNVTSTNGFTLAGAANGQLNILAGNSIQFQGSSIVMLDIPAANMSPYSAPRFLNMDPASDGGVLADIPGDAVNLAGHIDGGLHTNDPNPVQIVALNGDITGQSNLQEALVLPKLAQISAGHNIQDLGFDIQNNNATDVTTETAGNDIIDSTVVPAHGSTVNTVANYIEGPGRIDISAGHNLDLGDSTGIITYGNQNNTYLAAGGAAIDIQAGVGPANYVAFADKYVTPTSLTNADQQALLALVNSGPSLTKAWKTFIALPEAQQAAFLDSIKPDLNAIFFAQLVTSSSVKGLKLFDATIASLFPDLNPSGGDINIFGSTLQTQQGGSINLFAPGGSVYAGLNVLPAYLTTAKTPSQLGIFTIGGGAVGSLVHTNFEVDQGRVFTLAGGDITLVSQYGDLSAGQGTKTASSAPPPILTTDAQGNTRLDISGSIAGSGIATLQTDPEVPPANVYVIAPRGTFDAGDAGVRSSGSVDVNALVVLNAGNIVASGTVSGVPSVESSNLGGAVPSNATPSTSDLTKNIANAATANAGDTTSLSVDVLGYGAAAGSGTDCKEAKDCADDKQKGSHKNSAGTSN